jgi:hypothetical protein
MGHETDTARIMFVPRVVETLLRRDTHPGQPFTRAFADTPILKTPPTLGADLSSDTAGRLRLCQVPILSAGVQTVNPCVAQACVTDKPLKDDGFVSNSRRCGA